MEIEKRIEVAKLFIAKLAEICGGNRGLKLTAPAKVWQGGNKVRVYGLARQGYVEILEDGTVRRTGISSSSSTGFAALISSFFIIQLLQLLFWPNDAHAVSERFQLPATSIEYIPDFPYNSIQNFFH